MKVAFWISVALVLAALFVVVAGVGLADWMECWRC